MEFKSSLLILLLMKMAVQDLDEDLQLTELSKGKSTLCVYSQLH